MSEVGAVDLLNGALLLPGRLEGRDETSLVPGCDDRTASCCSTWCPELLVRIAGLELSFGRWMTVLFCRSASESLLVSFLENAGVDLLVCKGMQ